MHERIMELAIEARKYAESKPDIYQIAYDKKFAQLIINECYNRAEGQYHHSGDEWDKGVMAVMDSIEELFQG